MTYQNPFACMTNCAQGECRNRTTGCQGECQVRAERASIIKQLRDMAFHDAANRIEELEKQLAALSTPPAVPGNGQVYGIIDPDYGRIYTIVRKLAWEEGYAIGLHGSFTRDLDLIAVPWAERRCEPAHLVRRIINATGLKEAHGNPGAKPHDRLVWTLLLPDFGDPRFVDLSIMPALSAAPQGEHP